MRFHYLASLPMATVFALTTVGAALADPAPARDLHRIQDQQQLQDCTQQWLRDQQQDMDRLQQQLQTNLGPLAMDRLRTHDRTQNRLCTPDRLQDRDKDQLRICV